ncbi:PSD1 and planctomycete cytochrome C domain-containing protein [Calycomorphotria hydatis]|uniref:Planctomycete cytochrome C n=1 Tax=Calycomorphotria hydatis TaxID=2528027 RepID=A0A517TDS4_9PLAN|nr:PSD1 and planctomycete cytochrome C domain-containing protein [Calycomorphotria hydatis]QDT66517.1 Planctomycete cytochrome C [Calycomorphotria hydatis]
MFRQFICLYYSTLVRFNMRTVAACLLLGLVSPRVMADDVSYLDDILPILEAHCIGCHGEDEPEGRFRIDRRNTLLRGGDSGEPAVVPGKPFESMLIRVISGEDPDLQMPPDDERLSEKEVQIQSLWVKQGAQMPAELHGDDVDSAALEHWSFQPVRRKDASRYEIVAGESPIDFFIGRKLKENQLQISPEADRRTKIRRLYLVMHGLPPALNEIEKFLNDDSEQAWEELVERVLSSPRYGERWAQHWLDLIRFGETHGFETNRERPTAWKFRDYVIESLNNDKPFNQFVREQIAGDALGDPIGTGFLVAGPYDQVKGGGNLAVMQRMNELDDMINTTGTTFLGLSLGCARCHNHKFDPVTQSDYYALQAIFTGVKHGTRQMPLSPEAREQLSDMEARIVHLEEKLRPFSASMKLAAQENSGQKRPPVNPKTNVEAFEPRLAKFVRFSIQQTNGGQPCLDELEIYAGDINVALAESGATATSSGDFVHPLHKLEHINDGRYGNARSWIGATQECWVQIEFAEPHVIDRIVWGRDREGSYSDRLAVNYRIESALEPEQWDFVSGSIDRESISVELTKKSEQEYDFSNHLIEEAETGKQWLKKLNDLRKRKDQILNSQDAYAGKFDRPGVTHRLYRGEPDQKREVVEPGGVSCLSHLELDNTSGEQERRVALANWLASDENPLTARVIVNRLWQHHFGVGLVDTPSDFGANGSRPTHPELLDWLAAELISNGWSLKHIHRLILNTRSWQQDSRPRAEAIAKDASSRLLWRFPPRRLEAEAIRDSTLAVSGVLNLQMGGPGFSGFKVHPENVRHYFPKDEYGPADWRRMIYMTKVRQEKESVFGVFDCPDASQAVSKRSRSTTPLQAFNLFNSSFVVQQSELLAKRLERTFPSSGKARAGHAYELVFGRPATSAEVDDAHQFARQFGWPALCRAFFNSNEFVFIP